MWLKGDCFKERECFVVTLRKCPSCKEIVGAESEVCARCGVNFRAAQIRRIVSWTLFVILLLWLASRFVVKVR